ncbi:MAG: DUF4149 domain-containing protein [Campylobacterales bacterium]|nr:DUF4149 domain-containing protein [Campylobacterales bacterium]
MSKIFRFVTMFYVIFLASVMGASLYAGAVVAPVIFNTEDVFGEAILSHFQEGMIMTENFIRLSYVITLSIVTVAFYEGYRYKKGERDVIAQIATLLIICSGLLFSYYYMPDILVMQQAGPQMTQSEAFANTHIASEIDFKVFVFSILVLLVRNLQRALR